MCLRGVGVGVGGGVLYIFRGIVGTSNMVGCREAHDNYKPNLVLFQNDVEHVIATNTPLWSSCRYGCTRPDLPGAPNLNCPPDCR